MQINSKLFALGCTAILFGATAFAIAPDAHEQLEAFDLDRNGLFSPAEIDSAAEQIFARADANRDGRVTPEELHAMHGGAEGHGERHQGEVQGPMTLAEFRDHLRRHVAEADANRDGQLSMDEIEAMHRRHESRTGKQ